MNVTAENVQIARILVPVDFSPCSDAALRYALALADAHRAEVELLHVCSAHERAHSIFADSTQGRAMQRRLTVAEARHPTRVSGRLEFGDDPGGVIVAILEREHFDLVVLGRVGNGHPSHHAHHPHAAPPSSGELERLAMETTTSPLEEDGDERGSVASQVAECAPCKVVTLAASGCR